MGLGKKLSVAVAASFMSLSISLMVFRLLKVISLKRIKQISSPKTRLRNQNSLHQMTSLSSSF